MFESIIGHEKEKKTIENILKNNTFSHAYLFVGPSGIGKCLFAYELAKVLLNTNKVTSMQSMFQACTNLITIPLLDTSSCLNMQNMFQGCTKLSDDSLNNIMKMCINTPSNYARTKSLSNIGLNGPQRTTCQTLSNYLDFLDAGWSDS